VPSELVEQLSAEGIGIVRVGHPEDLPMHAKFLLIDHGDERVAWIGSYNFNKKSRRHNAETLLRIDDPAVFEALENRFGEIAGMAS
jgi:phosphatidylserine/phosphatidylglycerophosphate/cardiolipin synthase-like enzyme